MRGVAAARCFARAARAMADTTPFGEDGFQPAAWVNAALASHSGETGGPEKFIAELEMRLTLAAEELEASLAGAPAAAGAAPAAGLHRQCSSSASVFECVCDRPLKTRSLPTPAPKPVTRRDQRGSAAPRALCPAGGVPPGRGCGSTGSGHTRARRRDGRGRGCRQRHHSPPGSAARSQGTHGGGVRDAP